jgi:hypothetical protein
MRVDPAFAELSWAPDAASAIRFLPVPERLLARWCLPACLPACFSSPPYYFPFSFSFFLFFLFPISGLTPTELTRQAMDRTHVLAAMLASPALQNDPNELLGELQVNMKKL